MFCLRQVFYRSRRIGKLLLLFISNLVFKIFFGCVYFCIPYRSLNAYLPILYRSLHFLLLHILILLHIFSQNCFVKKKLALRKAPLFFTKLFCEKKPRLKGGSTFFHKTVLWKKTSPKGRLHIFSQNCFVKKNLA